VVDLIVVVDAVVLCRLLMVFDRGKMVIGR